MGDTPNHRVKRDAGNRQEGVCSSAPGRAIYGSRWRDLISQPECGLEVLIGWEPHAHLVFPECFEVAGACARRLQWRSRHKLL